MFAKVLAGAGQAISALQSVLIPRALTEAMLGVTEKLSPDSTSAPLLVIITTLRPPVGVVGEMLISAVAVVGLRMLTLATVTPKPRMGTVVGPQFVRLPVIMTPVSAW